MASNITTLVEKAKLGDADAFSTLYQMYYPKMKGICINILREDKAVVDDLVQDAFVLAFVSLKDLKNTHRFSQWLTLHESMHHRMLQIHPHSLDS